MSEKIVASPPTPANGVRRFPAWAWVLLPALALALALAIGELRIHRVIVVSGHQSWSAAPSLEGAHAWRPSLIVPGNLNPSFEWLDQTSQMLSKGTLRVRHVDYENAPFGHDVRSASPYRWWLGAVTYAIHVLGGKPMGPSLESAALYSDLLLEILLVATVTVFVAWRFGAGAAALAGATLALVYPLNVCFLPGAPDDQGLATAAVLASILPLLAGVRTGPMRRRWFLAGGIAAGLGMWIAVPVEVPLVVGIALGGLGGAWADRGGEPLPWRTWALGGAAASLAGYGVEYFPSYLGSWDLRAVHPVYGVAWLGLGELLALAAGFVQGVRPSRGRALALALAASAAVAALPVAMVLTHGTGFLTSDLADLRLSRLPDGAAAKDLLAWLIHEGFSAVVVTTLLPLAVAGPALWLLVRGSTPRATRSALAISLGPVVVAAAFASVRLRWWAAVDAALLAVLVETSAALFAPAVSRMARIAWAVLVALAVVPGAVQAWPTLESGAANALDESEIVGLIERDLAQWMSLHSTDDGVVLAPTNATTALYYYGGLRGVGTLDWENQEGVRAVVRIVSASTPDEALELVGSRGITSIVIPSWDSQLDAFARLGLGQLDGSFVNGLHHWVVPPWLRPIPYPLPVITGFEGQSVLVLKVTEEQTDAILLSRIATYLIETDNLGLAASAGNALRKFQSDVSAIVARAQVQMARGETGEFAHTVETLLPRLTGEGERTLPWDRRIDLAVVLAQGQHLDLSRKEMARCLADVDEDKLLSLSGGALYHFEVLGRVLGMEIADPRLRRLAHDLLPVDIARRLKK